MKFSKVRMQILAGAVVAAALGAQTAANHNWRSYHWPITGDKVFLDVAYNFGGGINWASHMDQALDDWNASAVIGLARVNGNNDRSACTPTSGRLEACNYTYGQNGWLGIAQIWLSGRSHITQAVTKLNDTYFNTASYQDPAWRQLVACQEIAHDFGLDHQDERFNNRNLGSCMDYTNDPDGGAGGAVNNDPSNVAPNAHDFEQLLLIYNHKDSASANARPVPDNAARPEASDWGQLVRTNANNRVQVYEKDLGNGNRLITHVFWANPDEDAKGRHDQ